MLRPTAALTLALTTVLSAGCPWGSCGDTSFTGRESTDVFELLEDGTIDVYGTIFDPAAEGACEEICTFVNYEEVLTVDTCELTNLPADDTEGERVQIDCTTSGTEVCIGGRHHADLRRPTGGGSNAVGAWLAREAHGEAGSVIAFARLAAELRAHRAPESLIRRALTAARDEVRHARDVGALACAHGGDVRRVRASAPTSRSLLALAVENAVEGCVAETFAAALAGWQAIHAPDDVRAVAARIAPEEASHAELAWDLHRWLLQSLNPVEAAAVERARLQAWARLAAAPPVAPPEVRAALGLPDAAQATALANALAGAVGALAA